MNTKAVATHITNWLKTYSENSKTKGFVIGISGGIDSALTSTLCALTGKPLLCLTMPIQQPASHVSRAEEHIANLKSRFPNVSALEVKLDPVFDAFVATNEADSTDENTFLSLANARARLRMTTLYFHGQLHGYLVAGTGNKVEDFGVGFYTKYGDGGVDLSPIADLLKTEVYAIAKEIGVVDSILQAAPTDGLWEDDRTDEDQIGASYPELEWAMEQDQESKKPEDFEGRKREVLEIYLRYNRSNKHKMVPIPVCEIPADLK